MGKKSEFVHLGIQAYIRVLIGEAIKRTIIVLLIGANTLGDQIYVGRRRTK